MTAHDATSSDRRLGDIGTRIFYVSGIIGLASMAISLLVAMFAKDWVGFGRSYLTAFMFVLSLCLGGLFFTALQHAVRAGWSIVLRRFAEVMASNLTWIWILFLPVAACMWWTDLYQWRYPHDEQTAALIAGKQPFLSAGFWMMLAVAFFAVWAIFGRFYYANSVAQDSSGDVSLTHRMQRLAPLALLLYAVTQSYAAIAWMMSLEPLWFSTMYPVYFWAATCCGYFSLQIIVMFLVQKAGKLTKEITLEHYQDAGKMLFAFGVVFWAYIAFSQYMLIYYANIPEETTWYLVRQMGGWGAVSLLLLVGHFVLAFLLLISKHPKRMPAVLVSIAVAMLLLHYLDLYWLVKPMVPHQAVAEAGDYSELARRAASEPKLVGYDWTIQDLSCLAAVGGLFVAGTVRRLQKASLIPEQDPRLGESLAFENF